MKTSLTILFSCFILISAVAQVGIGTTSPNAQLDIKATSQTAPLNTDGILIPKIDEFPATPPTSVQDGMLVFVTGGGVPSRGFYYWDQGTTSWVLLTGGGGTSEWTDQGNYLIPADGNTEDVTIGGADNANSKLTVVSEKSIGAYIDAQNIQDTKLAGITNITTNSSSNSTAQTLGLEQIISSGNNGMLKGISTNLINASNAELVGNENILSSNGTGNQSGSINTLTNSGDGILKGTVNNITNTGEATQTGTENNLNGGGEVIRTGTANNLFGSSNGLEYGTNTLISTLGNAISPHHGSLVTLSGTGGGERFGYSAYLQGAGDGNRYGTEIQISNGGSGVHYGTYSTLFGTGTGIHYGGYNTLSGSGSGNQYGLYQTITNSSNGTHHGMVNNLSGTGSGNHYGVQNFLYGSGTGDQIGVNNGISNSGNGNHTGVINSFQGNGSGFHTGISNIFLGTATGIHTGVSNYIDISGDNLHFGISNILRGSGSGNKYGSYNSIVATAGGTHYGVYSDVLKSGSFAGYFLGNVAIGTNTVNTYTFPASRGTNGQIMQTDGVGNLSWITPVTSDTSPAWHDGGTTTNATTTSSNIYRSGSVGIGINNPDSPLHIVNTNSQDVIQSSFTNTTNNISTRNLLLTSTTNADNNDMTGFFNSVLATEATAMTNINGVNNFINNASLTGATAGTTNNLIVTGIGQAVALSNNIVSTGSGLVVGLNNFIQVGNGTHYGTFTSFTQNGASTADVFGHYVDIPSTLSTGTHFGVYSKATKTGSYAGYFLGRLSVGTTTSNNYILPASRGSNGQVMQTDGSGNVSWVTAADTSPAWYDEGTTTNATTNSSDIIRSGNIGLGVTNANSSIDIFDSRGGTSITITEDDTSGAVTNTPTYAIKTNMDNTNNTLSTGNSVGIQNNISSLNSITGVENNIISHLANGSPIYGTKQSLTNNGSGDAYGTLNVVQGAVGTNYGIYSQIIGTGYAGYFLGNVAIGSAVGNTYTLPTSRGTNGQIMQTDGSGNVSWVNLPTESQDWTLTGNTGTNPTTNFLGTLDNVGLSFRTNNVEKMRLTTLGTLELITATDDQAQIKNANTFNDANDANINFSVNETKDSWMVSSRETTPDNSGIYGNRDFVTIWSPGDSNRIIRFLDEDAWSDNDGDPYNNTAEKAYIDSNGQYVQASDRNRKENFNKISNALAKLDKLNGYTYTYKLNASEKQKGQKAIKTSGVIAQELYEILPEAVQINQNGEYFVHYAGIIPLLIEAIKEQQKEIEILKEEISELKKLEERIKKLEMN